MARSSASCDRSISDPKPADVGLRFKLALVTLLSLGAKLPDPPPSIASVEVSRQSVTHTIVLSEVQTWANKGLDPDVNAHREQPSTDLHPALVKGDGSVVWFVGHDLGQLENPGDTVRTWSLLLEVNGGEAKALWYEDHKEIPHTFAMGAGKAKPGKHPGVLEIELALTDADYSDPVTLKATVRAL